MFVIGLAVILLAASAATAQMAPPQPTFPACGTFAQTTVTATEPVLSAIASIDTTSSGVSSRVDVVQAIGKAAFQQSTTLVPAGKGVAFFLTNFLNGTTTCWSTKVPAAPPPTFPPLNFVGVEQLSGVQVNHWQQTPTSGTNMTLDLWTLASNNDELVYAVGGGARSTFSHQVVCQSGSLDPSLFLPPAGLSCPQTMAWLPTPSSAALEAMMTLTGRK